MVSVAISFHPNGHLNDLAGTHRRSRLAAFPCPKANLTPICGEQNDKADSPPRQILPVGKTLIRRHENFVSFSFRHIEQLAVVLIRSALLGQRIRRVRRKALPQRSRRALIEQHLQCASAFLSARASCSSTARTCFLSTPGNHSTNSSIVAPLAKFSNRAYTGTRVPVKAQAPLILPGLRSTAGQFSQSTFTSFRHQLPVVVSNRSASWSTLAAGSSSAPSESISGSPAAALRTSSLPVTTSAIKRHGIRVTNRCAVARTLYARVNVVRPTMYGLRDVLLFFYVWERHINPTEVLEVEILSVPNEVRRRLERRNIADRFEQVTEIPHNQLSSRVQNSVRGPNAAARPGSFDAAF